MHAQLSQSEQHKSKHTYVQHTNHICAASLDAKYANAQDSIKSSTHIITRLEHNKKSKRLLCLHRCSLRHHSEKCTSICTNTPHKSRGKYYLIRLHSHRASKKITNHTFNHIFHPHRAYATHQHISHAPTATHHSLSNSLPNTHSFSLQTHAPPLCFAAFLENDRPQPLPCAPT